MRKTDFGECPVLPVLFFVNKHESVVAETVPQTSFENIDVTLSLSCDHMGEAIKPMNRITKQGGMVE
jgi:hypothetical protein